MTEIAIRVERLGKEYRIGAHSRQRTFRETINDVALAPWRRARSVLKGQATQGNSQPFWAMRDVSFDVQRGEVVGVIGRNGAGKSTLLKILSRITLPTEGHAEIHGRIGTLLEVGTGFHPELTGRENIYLNGAILGMSRGEINRKFDEIVAFAEVEQFIDTMVKHYSSGMYLRLAFAVAAHLEPEILIVDEVLAVGDAQFQKKCLGKMGDVAREGRTVLFVSHNMAAIRGLCQRALWLSRGALIMDGPANEVLNRYLLESSTASTSDIDLRGVVRRSDMGKRLRITNITFNRGAPMMNGEPLHVELAYETSADVYGVAFGFGFTSLEGTRLLSIDSDLNAPRFSITKNQRGSAVMMLDTLYLDPGVYMLDIGARSGDSGGLDYMAACVQVEVLPGPTTPSIMSRLDYAGSVHFAGTWQWSPTAIEEAA